MITGSDMLNPYLMPDHISDSDDEPPIEVERDPDEDYEVERILEAEEAAYRAARQKRAREELPLMLAGVARVPAFFKRQAD
jgi:hypothetical protein